MSDDTRHGRHAAPEGKTRGRHRAPDPVSSPLNLTPLTAATPRVGERRAAMDLERKLVREATSAQHRATAVAATTGLIMISSMSGAVAHAASSEITEAPETGSNSLVLAAEDPIIVADDVAVTHPKVDVETTAAPPPPPLPPARPAPVAKQAAPRHAAPAPAPAVPAPKVATPAPAPSASGKGSIIAYSALSQLGRTQDCTMLVTNALKAAGISHHGWPISYFALGSQVSAAEAQPGDLIYYANGGMGMAHIAVYIGNGMAVHGGWNGNQTVTFSANVGSGPVFIRVA